MIGNKALDTLGFLALYEDAHGQPPLLREIAEAVGLAGARPVWWHCRSWVRDGFVEELPDRHRKYKITDRGRWILELYRWDPSRLKTVPGQPTLAAEVREGGD